MVDSIVVVVGTILVGVCVVVVDDIVVVVGTIIVGVCVVCRRWHCGSYWYHNSRCMRSVW